MENIKHNPWDIDVINGWGSQLDVLGLTPDPLDKKPVINHFGEQLHTLTGRIKCHQKYLTIEQMEYSGLEIRWVYEIE